MSKNSKVVDGETGNQKGRSAKDGNHARTTLDSCTPKSDNRKNKACEKCWSDAYRRMICDSSKSQTEHYYDLLKERKDNPCKIRIKYKGKTRWVCEECGSQRGVEYHEKECSHYVR